MRARWRMAVSSRGDPSSSQPRRWGVRLLIVFAVAVFVVFGSLAAIAIHAPGQLAGIEAFVKAVKPWAIATQLLAVGVVWLRWTRIVHWLAARRRIRDKEVGPLLRARHRLALLLFVMVLTLGAGFPFSLLASSAGG